MESDESSSEDERYEDRDRQNPLEPTSEAISTAVRKALSIDHDLECRRLSEGTDHAVYAIGDKYIARCYPATKKNVASLDRDVAVQNLAREYSSKPSVVPEVIARLELGQWQGNLERRMTGQSLEVAQPTEKTEGDLARLLADLRSIPVEDAVKATGYQKEPVNIKARVTKAIRAWEELVQKGHAVDPEEEMSKLLKERLQYLSTLPSEEHKPVFTHADINSENILINPQDGSITGIIDWSDALVGDACVDISGVVFAIGLTRARRVGKKAELSELAMERAILYTMTEMIRDLRKVLCGDSEQKHLEGLLRDEFKRVFEGTGMEKALVV